LNFINCFKQDFLADRSFEVFRSGAAKNPAVLRNEAASMDNRPRRFEIS